MALFMGARMNELTQLWRDDLIIRDRIQCIRIDEVHPNQRVKTKNRRIVPIHPEVIKLGFLKFANPIKEGPLFGIRRAGFSTPWAT